MGNVLSPLHNLNASNPNSSVWLPTIKHPNLSCSYGGQTNIVDFLSNSSPTLILEMVAQTAIDAYLLGGKKTDCLERLWKPLIWLSNQLQVDIDVHPFSLHQSPVAYLRNRFVNSNGSLNATTLIDLAGAFAGVFLPDYILSQDTIHIFNLASVIHSV